MAAQIEVELTDVDEDGALTIADALYLAHEAAFEGGAEAGFADAMGEYLQCKLEELKNKYDFIKEI